MTMANLPPPHVNPLSYEGEFYPAYFSGTRVVAGVVGRDVMSIILRFGHSVGIRSNFARGH